MEHNRLLEEEQNGFRSSRSCAQHLFVLQEVMRDRLNNGKSLHLCFVDFSKAFDLLDRNLLFSKLTELGIQGRMYQAIKQSCDITLNAVQINGECSRWFTTKNGVKQGDNFSPSLWSVYVNGLLKEIKESKIGIKVLDYTVSVLAYADDIVLLSPTQVGLQ